MAYDPSINGSAEGDYGRYGTKYLDPKPFTLNPQPFAHTLQEALQAVMDVMAPNPWALNPKP